MTERQKLIKNLINSYKKNFPKQYKTTIDSVKSKRASMKDPEHGLMIDKGKTKREMLDHGDVRLAVRINNKVNTMVNRGIQLAYGEDAPDFLYKDGELKWFKKRFPEFVIPKKT